MGQWFVAILASRLIYGPVVSLHPHIEYGNRGQDAANGAKI